MLLPASTQRPWQSVAMAIVIHVWDVLPKIQIPKPHFNNNTVIFPPLYGHPSSYVTIAVGFT